jgi:FkbM family methyltransferase
LALNLSDPNHVAMARSGSFESETTQLFVKLLLPGDVFFDVGAHVGWYSFVAFSRGPGIAIAYAYEPLAEAFDLLQRNVELNRVNGRCIPRRVAMSDRAGTGSLKRFAEIGSMHSSLYQLADLPGDTEEVPLTTIDAEAMRISRAPSIVKCDVEGAERMVMEGAQQISRGTLGTPPIWMLEVNYETAAMAGYFPWSLIEVAANLNEYQPFHIRSGKLRSLPDNRSLRHGDVLVLAIPAVHSDRLAKAGYVGQADE